ncbi:MAG: ABC transporter ATP-binding protein [Peptostreptococcaceae bacterium]|nr:ABC transporter ATP-binding protein [Peptostreptococcaceae bacterium]
MIDFQKIFMGFRKMQGLNFLVVLMGTGVKVGNVFLIRTYMDRIIYQKGTTDILLYSVLIAVLAGTVVLMNGVQSYCWHRLRQGGINHMRAEAFSAALKKSFSFLNERPIGALMAQIMDDSSMIAQIRVIGRLMIYANTIRICIFFGVLVYLSPLLSAVVGIGMSLYFLFFHLLNAPLRRASGEERDAYEKVMTDIQEKFQGVSEIKIYRKEAYFANQFIGCVKEYDKNCRKLNFMEAVGSMVSEYATGFVPSAVLICGAYLIYKGQLSVGSLIAFNTFLSFLHEPISNLSDLNVALQRSRMIETKMGELMKEEVEDKKKTLPKEKIESLEFQNVSFFYQEEQSVLSDFNLKINRGDRIAILGESGAGKSTLIKLLTKSVYPKKGKIFVGKRELSEISAESIYERISLMSQQPFLFSGSLLENITLGEEYSREEINEVIEVVHLSEMIAKLSHGIDTQITKDGINISGGEKQRIALARALLKKSDILILDEPTSAIDPMIEKAIIQGLRRYVQKNNSFMIVITHKMQMLEICNKNLKMGK